jgi:hypothetical protein
VREDERRYEERTGAYYCVDRVKMLISKENRKAIYEALFKGEYGEAEDGVKLTNMLLSSRLDSRWIRISVDVVNG